jgi:hypothetical protein
MLCDKMGGKEILSMEQNNRIEVGQCLNEQWGTYIERFKNMSKSQQQEFLKKQGYLRLADLMAHIAAWWTRGMDSIEQFLVDPDYVSPSVEVDAFNARAVKAVEGLSEEEVLRNFEETRMKFATLVTRLSDQDLQNEKVIRQLNMELLGHYQEHQF